MTTMSRRDRSARSTPAWWFALAAVPALACWAVAAPGLTPEARQHADRIATDLVSMVEPQSECRTGCFPEVTHSYLTLSAGLFGRAIDDDPVLRRCKDAAGRCSPEDLAPVFGVLDRLIERTNALQNLQGLVEEKAKQQGVRLACRSWTCVGDELNALAPHLTFAPGADACLGKANCTLGSRNVASVQALRTQVERATPVPQQSKAARSTLVRNLAAILLIAAAVALIALAVSRPLRTKLLRGKAGWQSDGVGPARTRTIGPRSEAPAPAPAPERGDAGVASAPPESAGDAIPFTDEAAIADRVERRVAQQLQRVFAASGEADVNLAASNLARSSGSQSVTGEEWQRTQEFWRIGLARESEQSLQAAMARYEAKRTERPQPSVNPDPQPDAAKLVAMVHALTDRLDALERELAALRDTQTRTAPQVAEPSPDAAADLEPQEPAASVMPPQGDLAPFPEPITAEPVIELDGWSSRQPADTALLPVSAGIDAGDGGSPEPDGPAATGSPDAVQGEPVDAAASEPEQDHGRFDGALHLFFTSIERLRPALRPVLERLADVIQTRWDDLYDDEARVIEVFRQAHKLALEDPEADFGSVTMPFGDLIAHLELPSLQMLSVRTGGSASGDRVKGLNTPDARLVIRRVLSPCLLRDNKTVVPAVVEWEH